MALDSRIIAIIDLAIRLLLITAISIAAYLAKKRQLKKHCTIMMFAVPVETITVAAL